MEGHRLLLEYDFDSGHLRTLRALHMTGAALSFIFGSFVVLSYGKFEVLRKNFALEQIANMALSDIGGAVAAFLGSPRDRSALCGAQGFLLQFCKVASVFWATVIATTLYASLKKRESIEAERWRPYAYAFAYGIPLFFAILPFSTSSYGSAGAWCWIRTKPRLNSNAWRFSIFYVPSWVCIIYNAMVYAECAFVFYRLSTVVDDDASAKLKRSVRRLLAYPAILVLCWVFPTVNRIQQSIDRRPIFTLYVLHVISLSLIGTLNALAFGATDNVKAAWAEYFRLGYKVTNTHQRRHPDSSSADSLTAGPPSSRGHDPGIELKSSPPKEDTDLEIQPGFDQVVL